MRFFRSKLLSVNSRINADLDIAHLIAVFHSNVLVSIFSGKGSFLVSSEHLRCNELASQSF